MLSRHSGKALKKPIGPPDALAWVEKPEMPDSRILRLERYEELVSYRQRLIESLPGASGEKPALVVLADQEGMRTPPATAPAILND